INSLPIGGLLPDGVFALISSRRGFLEPAPDTYQLELAGLTHNDIRALLVEVSARFAIEQKHLDAIQEISQGNSLYVRMLVNDLSSGRLALDEIDQLPAGLEGYFEDFLKRLSIDDSWPVLRDCLLLLAIARSHLSVNQVCAITDLTWAEVEGAM